MNVYVNDMVSIAETGKWPLEAQIRAYDLFEQLSDGVCPFTGAEVEEYLGVYEANALILSEVFDSEVLVSEAAEALKPYEEALNEARFKAAAAASLHEFTKDTFAKWQDAGVFMRKRLLKDLRERAGFPLESHRIGNYVAKTYDLMEEARRAYQKAQQAFYSNNVSYSPSTMEYLRNGYTQTGWQGKTHPGAAYKTTNDSTGGASLSTSDGGTLFLAPVWTENTYTIKYNWNDTVGANKVTDTSDCPTTYSITSTDTFGVFTNNIHSGAMRGYSSPQLIWAQEQFIDEVATRIIEFPLEKGGILDYEGSYDDFVQWKKERV